MEFRRIRSNIYVYFGALFIMALRRATDEIAEILVDKERRLLTTLERRGVIAGKIEGRNTDGTVQVQSDKSECILRSAIDTEPDTNLIGVSGVGFSAGIYGVGIVWVEELDPRDLFPNQTQTVDVIGRGLREGMTFVFLLPDGEPHPLAEVTEVNFMSSELIELTVVVGDAGLIENAPIQYSW